MNLIALDLPDVRAERIAWLQEKIVSHELRDLVIQLALAQTQPISAEASNDAKPELDDDRLQLAAEEGLSVLSDDEINRLLAHPQQMLDLQEQVFLLDPAAWQSGRLGSSEQNLAPDGEYQSVNRNTKSPSASDTHLWRRSLLSLAALAGSVAALLMLSLMLWNTGQNANPQMAEWGWLAPDALQERTTATAYLEQLAEGGQAWFNKVPDSAESYQQRLRELMAGCERLIEGEHRSLNANQASQLVEKCRKWQEKFEQQSQMVQDDPESFLQAKAQTDETVNKLVPAILQLKETI